MPKLARNVILVSCLLFAVLAGGCRAGRAAERPTATTAIQPSETDVAAGLAGLDIDAFFETSWRELSLRDPEGVLANGLAEVYELEGVELTNISDAYVRETQQMVATILEMLRAYDRDELTPEQQVSYDVYEWYLDDLVRQQEFMYYDYPATFFPVTAVHEQLIYFFTDLHPIADKQDAQDYVTRLGQVDVKFEQLLEGLKLREEGEIVPPKFATQWALYGVRKLAQAEATHTPFYEAFEEKVNALKDAGDAEKQALLAAAQEAIDEAVLPAFQALAHYLEHLESIGSTDDGVWQFPDGEEVYAHMLRHYTTTGMTADEIHELGLQELERIHAEMRIILDELGYPEDESLAELFDRVAQDGGYVSGGQVIETYIALIEQADQKLDVAFDIRPEAEVIVVASPIKGLYVPGSLDGSRPGAFHAGPGDAKEALYAMPTLAYHEALPGHHFQIALAQESDLPSFRNSILFLGYTEGWALYAEQLAWELGWYQDDAYGNLGRLQAEAFRAARLVIDTGIHAKGWTFDQAVEFLIENVGFESGDSVEPSLQIARYIVWPGQATAYKIGMLKILELRHRAMDQLGDRFDLKEFHNVVLSNGSMPLEVLERVVDGYIQTKLTSTPSLTPPPRPIAASYRAIRNEPYVDRGLPEQTLDIYLPLSATGSLPTLFAIHGANRRKRDYAHLADFFVPQGYAVISIEFRNGLFPTPSQDAFCALAWTHVNAERYGFDPERIVAVGHSKGGALATMLGSVDEPAPFMEDCPHSLPEADWVQGVVTFGGRFIYVDEMHAAHDIEVNGNAPPFLLIYGLEDKYDADLAEGYAAVLGEAGGNVQLVSVPGEHLSILTSRRAFQAVEAFVARLWDQP